MRFETVPQLLQLFANLGVIINLTVERNHCVAVLRAHRLIAAAQIDNLQPHRTQRRMRRFMGTLLIRTPMIQTLHRPAQYASRRFPPKMSKPRYAAHSKPTRIED